MANDSRLTYDVVPGRIRRCIKCEISKEISSFPTHKTSRFGHRHTCKICWRGDSHKKSLDAHFEVRRDPEDLFRLRRFRRWDFLYSLDGQVWAVGTEVADEERVIYQVVYEPEPGLVRRSDGLFFRLQRQSTMGITLQPVASALELGYAQ